MAEKQGYLEHLQKFYDNRLLREVYRSERVIVCNAFNQFYVAIDRSFVEKFEKYGNNIPVFVMNSVGLKEIVKDNAFVSRFYMSLSEEKQANALRWLDDSMFDSFMRRADSLRQKPVTENVDLEFEAELAKIGADAMKVRLHSE